MQEELGQFMKLLRELQKIDNEFPLQYAVCLSEIALNEGLSHTDLAVRTDMPISTVSRVVTALSKHSGRGVSYGLVKVNVSANERRKRQITLTAKGRAIIHGVTDLIKDMNKARGKVASRR